MRHIRTGAHFSRMATGFDQICPTKPILVLIF
jgi:hypothetical protein